MNIDHCNVIVPFPFHEIRGELNLKSYMTEWQTAIRFGCTLASINLDNCTLHQPLYLKVKSDNSSIEIRDLTLYSNIDISAEWGSYEPAELKGYNAFSIREASPSSIIRFRNIIFPNNPKFEESFCEFNLQFNNCIFSKWINLGDPLQLAKISFIGCSLKHISFNKLLQHLPIFKACTFEKRNGRNCLSSDRDYTFENLAETRFEREQMYQNLKMQAQSNEARLLASDWHYWEKYYCEKRIFTEGTALEWLILRIYRLLSDYGESVGKAACWLLVFILTTIFFGVLAPSPAAEAKHISLIANAALTYIPLGSSAPKDAGWLRFFQIFWQALITFQATLLGFALRNRYRR